MLLSIVELERKRNNNKRFVEWNVYNSDVMRVVGRFADVGVAVYPECCALFVTLILNSVRHN